MDTVLVVESVVGERNDLAEMIANHGCAVKTASSLNQAREILTDSPPQMVISAVQLPDGSGVELLRDLEASPAIEVVLTASDPDLESAIAAVRLGALDFLRKPIDTGDVRRVLAAGLGETSSEERLTVSFDAHRVSRLGDLITVSPIMRRVFHRIERVAPTDVMVMVVGASGTGKELVARAVHQLSSRKDGPFLAVNCGAIAPSVIESELFGHERGSFTGADRRHIGYFERAAGGTLLLDEITEMSEDLQVKLLRVIETGKVLRVGGTSPVKASPRVVATTNRDPERATRTGELREDLFFRLKAFQIRVPTLIERGPEEIELFARHFLKELNREHDQDKKMTQPALECLKDYGWPGNVRELRNAIEAAFVLAKTEIDSGSLSLEIVRPSPEDLESDTPEIQLEVGASIAEAEKELILATLDHLEGDKPEAAKTLGISLKTLYNRLKGYRRGKQR
jgi:DNA-binding NtrC family response regulator